MPLSFIRSSVTKILHKIAQNLAWSQFAPVSSFTGNQNSPDPEERKHPARFKKSTLWQDVNLEKQNQIKQIQRSENEFLSNSKSTLKAAPPQAKDPKIQGLVELRILNSVVIPHKPIRVAARRFGITPIPLSFWPG